jgi:hypothetical protein
MANRYPIIVDTTNGNQFRELPDGDNLLLTNSSIVNVLDITSVGTITSNRLVVNGQEFTGSYSNLTDKPLIPTSVLDLGVLDGQVGQFLTTNGNGVISFQNIPTQDPTLGGVLTGTASNAQLANGIITEANLDVPAAGLSGQVLASDGAGGLSFVDQTGGTGTGGGAANYIDLGGTIPLTDIPDDFIPEVKLYTVNAPVEGYYLTVNADGDLEYRELTASTISWTDITNKPTIPSTLTDLGVTEGNSGDFLTTNGNGEYDFVELTTVQNIEFSGTTITTINDNTNIALDPKGNGYVSILGTNAVVIPAGTTAERAPTTQGAIRFNNETSAFEGFDGTYWGSLGGIKDADSDTYITTESAAGADEDTFTMYTGGQQSATLSSNLFNVAQGVRVKINSTDSALDFDTGALSVDGGVSIRGNLLVSGTIDVNEQYDTSTEVACTMLTETQTNILTVPTASDMNYFKAGQSVRVYGASEVEIISGVPTLPTAQTNANLSLEATVVGFGEPDPGDEVIFGYRTAQINFVTGKISSSTATVEVSLIPDDVNNFNNGQNIQLTVSRQSSSHGILVYRKVGSEVAYKLIKVLGPKDLGASLSNISWTDYYDFDAVAWSRKDASNAFTEDSGLTHVSPTAPTASKFGWTDTTIQNVDLDNNQLVLSDSVFSSQTDVVVMIDDTALVQNKIDLAKAQNRNSLELENRTYYIRQLVIPSDFTLYGQGDQTRIIKAPWSINPITGSNSIITVDTDTYSEQNNISVKNLRIDGNAQNQLLASDIVNGYLNYAVYAFGNDILFENIEIENVIGGGIYAYDSSVVQDLTILNCEITNGTLTYVYEDYGPVYADEYRNIKFAHNTFRNFPGPVSISAVQKGIVSPNVVDNCGSGIFAYGASKIVLTPNVLLGPAGEFIQNPDVLNSEYDSVNVEIEQDVDFNSPQYVYQRNGEFFDFTANQTTLTAFINELVKTDNVEELSTDYSENLVGAPYIQFTNSGDANGAFAWRIVKASVNDLLSRAAFSVLRATNPNSQGLVYRIIGTDYNYLGNDILGGGTFTGGQYTIPVDSLDNLPVGTVIRLSGHNTDQNLATEDGVITAINTTNKTISIEFSSGNISDVTIPANTVPTGTVLIQNNFVVVKGKIN